MSTLKVGEIKHESFTGTTQLKLDSAGRLLVGTTTEGASGADQFTVASSSHGGLTIRSGSTSNGNLMFSDGTSGAAEYAGYIQYEHDNNRLNIGSNGSTRVNIESAGTVKVNQNLSVTGIATVGSAVTITSDGIDAGTTTVTATKFSGNTAQGGGSDSVFQMNGMTITQDFEFPDGQSAMSVGPITINSGVEVTVPDGQNWVIL